MSKQDNFHEPTEFLYSTARYLEKSNPKLGRICLLGAIYGQLVNSGRISPVMDLDSNVTFNFLEEMLTEEEWEQFKHDL